MAFGASNQEGNEKDEGLEGNGVDNLGEDTQNDSGGQKSPDDGNQGSNDNGASGDKMFTQDDVNRMMAKEKKQGKNSVYNELGIDPNDTKSIALIKALVASQKEQNEGANSNASNEQIEEANHRAVVAEAKAEAMMIGILPKYVDDAVALALPKVDDENDIKTVMKDLKAKYPIWVKPDDDDSGSVGKKGTGSSVGSSSDNKNKKNEGIGARLAASRKASKPKQSYWGNK